jgi:hypothetical protein
MIAGIDYDPIHLSDLEEEINIWNSFSEDAPALKYILDYLKELINNNHKSFLKSFKTFLPPRLVNAAKKGSLVPFFGAGISAGAGVPTWASLLEKLGIPREFANDPYLENDALTMAELIAHEIGNDELQKELRTVMNKPRFPTLVHYLLARLSQPVYITPNYDNLFEKAFNTVHGYEPLVVTNDADFAQYNIDLEKRPVAIDKAVLLKIHGSAQRDGEEMILTRSQYRRHYRSNKKLFETVRSLIKTRHTLFFGFGHRDPEISRLVEDVIHQFETGKVDTDSTPAIYSLQFDMKEKTPEVFAARGMVALQPPFSLDSPDSFDYRSASSTKALVDLIGAMDSDVHKQLDLDDELNRFILALKKKLEDAVDKLEKAETIISKVLTDNSSLQKELDNLRDELRDIAGQGVYLLKANGDIRGCSLKAELKYPKRREEATLHNRFYVRQAKTYRHSFISDTDKSTFNGQSTFFICHPLGGEKKYLGLLFAAAQVGDWKLPLELKEVLLKKHPDASFILVDSNGVALLPPNNDEMPVSGPKKLPEGEKPEDNMGFDFEAIHRLSRRDKLISCLWKNIVPLAQDDDVQIFSDLKMYSVVSCVPETRWKLALSMPLTTR